MSSAPSPAGDPVKQFLEFWPGTDPVPLDHASECLDLELARRWLEDVDHGARVRSSEAVTTHANASIMTSSSTNLSRSSNQSRFSSSCL